MNLTKRQLEVLEYFRSSLEQNGIAPTVREICEHFGLTGPAGIHRILNVLVEKGYLSKIEGKKRAWRIEGGYTGKSLPIIGRIAAGRPILAFENREDELPVDPTIFGSDDCFLLHVSGDSMIEAHIKDGDLAVIRPQNHGEHGQIVAVIVQDMLDEATLKRLYKTKSSTELHAANPAYPPLIFKGRQRSRIRIVGKLTGIIRRNA